MSPARITEYDHAAAARLGPGAPYSTLPDGEAELAVELERIVVATIFVGSLCCSAVARA